MAVRDVSTVKPATVIVRDIKPKSKDERILAGLSDELCKRSLRSTKSKSQQMILSQSRLPANNYDTRLESLKVIFSLGKLKLLFWNP